MKLSLARRLAAKQSRLACGAEERELPGRGGGRNRRRYGFCRPELQKLLIADLGMKCNQGTARTFRRTLFGSSQLANQSKKGRGRI